MKLRDSMQQTRCFGFFGAQFDSGETDNGVGAVVSGGSPLLSIPCPSCTLTSTTCEGLHDYFH